MFRMELSPSGSTLATIDVAGKLSLYDVPSLKLRKSWSIEEQVYTLCVHVSAICAFSGRILFNEVQCMLKSLAQ